jgi:hypothetical protein
VDILAKLFVFFIVASIGMALRFFIVGKFGWEPFFLAMLWPAGAIIIWGVERWQIRRDANYTGSEPEDVWHTHMLDRLSTGKKPLFKGKEKIGEFHRFYPRWWQRIVNDVMADRTQWHVNLSFTLYNEPPVQFFEQRKRLFRVNDTWHIIQNDRVIGTVRTDYSWKNAMKMRERMILEADGHTFFFQSSQIRSRTEVLQNGEVIATGERSHMFGWQYRFRVNEGCEEWERLLMMTYVLFNYVHHQ